jgi:hypothetical protein
MIGISIGHAILVMANRADQQIKTGTRNPAYRLTILTYLPSM